MKKNQQRVINMYKNLLKKYKGEYPSAIGDNMMHGIISYCFSKDQARAKFMKPYLNILSAARFNYYLQITHYKKPPIIMVFIIYWFI